MRIRKLLSFLSIVDFWCLQIQRDWFDLAHPTRLPSAQPAVTLPHHRSHQLRTTTLSLSNKNGCLSRSGFFHSNQKITGPFPPQSNPPKTKKKSKIKDIDISRHPPRRYRTAVQPPTQSLFIFTLPIIQPDHFPPVFAVPVHTLFAQISPHFERLLWRGISPSDRLESWLKKGATSTQGYWVIKENMRFNFLRYLFLQGQGLIKPLV